MNAIHIPLIHQLLAAAEEQNLPLWLESGWAMDARLHKITREHDDIDLAFPIERQDQFIAILHTFGGGRVENTNYGFLIYVRDVLLDCEPCIQHGNNYELEGVPLNSCPWEKQGTINGAAVRCTSWESILWEYFYYLDEVPQTAWRAKDLESFAVVRKSLGKAKVEKLRFEFESARRGI
ncbi:MAG: aminoglycoside nucleotidyltransferase ANT(2'')-Ia [Anaerolineales bacterium]|nr:aminoglycoside nucleotidyltransferase ANT(2'')-Ia [Anaerolineales bacterium]